ncbi:hypothetical protein LG291_23180 [Cytobacillus firmus]|uniref:hypothetical protein n=1 Tax=Cytobacillus firmus TaxID=1399 RepID=UPI00384DEECF
MRHLYVLLLITLFILSGCKEEQDINKNIVEYEYLSKNEQYSSEINQWLNNAMHSEDESVYSLSSKDGNTYVYAKGHKKAKVTYLYEDTEGKTNRSLKVTLLKGNSNDDVFIKISYDSDLCCDVEILDDTDNENEFYAK